MSSFEFKEDNNKLKDARPSIFIFIGDRLIEFQEYIICNNFNSENLLHIYTTKTFEKDKLENLKISISKKNLNIRENILYEFIKEKNVKKLFKAVTILINRISSKDYSSNSIDSISVNFIVTVDDPMNVLATIIAMISKAYLKTKFKSVYIKLFILITESLGSSNQYLKIASLEFLKEIDFIQNIQKKSSQLKNGLLRIFKKIPIEIGLLNSHKLFDIVVFLSDKDNMGKIDTKLWQTNFRIIRIIDILDDPYAFNNINRLNSFYISAGLTNIFKPVDGIFLALIYNFLKLIIQRLKDQAFISESDLLKLIGLNEEALEQKIYDIVADDNIIKRMEDILIIEIKNDLKNKKIFEIEKEFFGRNLEIFFDENVVKRIKGNYEIVLKDIKKELKSVLLKIVKDNNFGLYWSFNWGSKIEEYIRNRVSDINKEMESIKEEIKEKYNKKFEMPAPIKLLLNIGGREKEILESAIKSLKDIYYLKKEVLSIEIKENILNEYINTWNLYSIEVKKYEILEELQEYLEKDLKRYVNEYSSYLLKNIKDYYYSLVENEVSNLEKSLGSNFYFSKDFLGNPYSLVNNKSKEQLLEKIKSVVDKIFIKSNILNKSFSQELKEMFDCDAGNNFENELTKIMEEFKKILNNRERISLSISNPEKEKFNVEKFYDFGSFNFSINEELKSSSYISFSDKSVECLTLIQGFNLKNINYYIKNLKSYEDYSKDNKIFSLISLF